MNIKVGDVVKVAQGVGLDRCSAVFFYVSSTQLCLPLVEGPNWEMGVMISNPPSCTFPFYIHYAWPEYAELITTKEDKDASRKEISQSKGISEDT